MVLPESKIDLVSLSERITELQQQIHNIQSRNQTDYTDMVNANTTKVQNAAAKLILDAEYNSLLNKIDLKKQISELSKKISEFSNDISTKEKLIGEARSQLHNDKRTMSAQFEQQTHWERKHHSTEWKSDCTWRISPGPRVDQKCTEKVQGTQNRLNQLENELKTSKENKLKFTNELNQKQKGIDTSDLTDGLETQAQGLKTQIDIVIQAEEAATKIMETAQANMRQHATDFNKLQMELNKAQETKEQYEDDNWCPEVDNAHDGYTHVEVEATY